MSMRMDPDGWHENKRMDASERWFEEAKRILPGGVNSPVRSFRGVGGVPRVIARASGCHLFDIEGRRYIDYIGSWGAMIAGHAHPRVVSALERAVRDGTSFGTPSPPELELAREIVARAGFVGKVRMVNSGTEAVMSAIRLARAATGRNRIVKFAGGYHGHADALLAQAGSGAATLGLPGSPGVTPGAAQDTMTLRFNDLAAAKELFAHQGANIAAVMVEPVAGNMGVVPPDQGFLETLRELTRRAGSLLIGDEVMTGFRVARGGAAERLGITPDLATFGKVIGGGLPVGAFGGRAELMDQIAPAGPVYQAGTLSGNPLAMTAGIATLALLDAAAYQQLERQSARLEEGLCRAFDVAGVKTCIQRVGSMLTVFFTQGPVRDFDAAKASDHRKFARFFHAMLQRGVHLPPSGYEAWFVSLAHDDAAMDETIAAAREAASEMGD